MDYNSKYLKYKNKYIKLRKKINNMRGGGYQEILNYYDSTIINNTAISQTFKNEIIKYIQEIEISDPPSLDDFIDLIHVGIGIDKKLLIPQKRIIGKSIDAIRNEQSVYDTMYKPLLINIDEELALQLSEGIETGSTKKKPTRPPPQPPQAAQISREVRDLDYKQRLREQEYMDGVRHRQEIIDARVARDAQMARDARMARGNPSVQILLDAQMARDAQMAKDEQMARDAQMLEDEEYARSLDARSLDARSLDGSDYDVSSLRVGIIPTTSYNGGVLDGYSDACMWISVLEGLRRLGIVMTIRDLFREAGLVHGNLNSQFDSSVKKDKVFITHGSQKIIVDGIARPMSQYWGLLRILKKYNLKLIVFNDTPQAGHLITHIPQVLNENGHNVIPVLYIGGGHFEYITHITPGNILLFSDANAPPRYLNFTGYHDIQNDAQVQMYPS